jgi:hypothetical protein
MRSDSLICSKLPRAARLILLAALPCLAAVATPACSSGPQSFIVLTLQVHKDESASEITGVVDVVVDVQKGVPPTSQRRLTYDARVLTGGTLTLQKDSTDRTLSVSFSGDESGTITFGVTAVNAQGCIVGRGVGSGDIRKGGSVGVTVPMTAAFDCNPDGGTPDGSGLFPGCDPVHPGTPDGGATMCAPSQTCQVNCTTMRNECTMGGTGAPGTICQSNLDCEPGTQCFDYSSTGCGVKVCLRFCDTKSDCNAFGASGQGLVGIFCV